MSAWRCTAVSVTGTAHLRRQEPCQDVSLCSQHADTLICAIADGAGGARHAEIGAQITVRHFAEYFGRITAAAAIGRDKARCFLRSLTELLTREAREARASMTDYACTLLGVIAAPDITACFQVGDGAIVVLASDPGSYECVCWPQHGEFANSTNFVTASEVADTFELRVMPAVREFAMFSDGLERLILDYSARNVHAPALRPIFEWFPTAAAADAEERTRALTAYLKSEHVARRTDDDKSLIVAVRTP
jgi:hypothetical protein